MGLDGARPHPEHPERGNAENGGDDRRRDQSQKQVEPEVFDTGFEDKDGGGVAARPEERGVPETGDPSVAPYYVQGQTEEGVDHHFRD